MVHPPRGTRRSALALVALLATLPTAPAAEPAETSAAAAAGPKLDFARDIRPILSAKCFACHGPDPKERKAGLRLDTPAGTFGPADSGNRAVVPGNLDESELYQRIIAEDPEERMPPAK